MFQKESVFRKGLSGKVAFEPGPEGGEIGSYEEV